MYKKVEKVAAEEERHFVFVFSTSSRGHWNYKLQ